MPKKIVFPFSLLSIWISKYLLIGCLAFSCSTKPNKQEIYQIIAKIEQTSNQQNLESYLQYSQEKSFYDLVKLLLGLAKTKKKESYQVVKMIPGTIQSTSDGWQVHVILDFDVDLSFSEQDMSVQMPKELINGILSIGLPSEADFLLKKIDGRLKLIKISYPWKYSFLKIFF